MPEIFKFWILHNPSGISLFEQTFEELEGNADPCVVAGFLFAIANITKNITQQEIEFVQMNEVRFSYLVQPKYMMILVSAKETKIGRIIQIIQEIQTKFEQKYLSMITPLFSGNVTAFKDFAQEVEAVVKHDTKYFQFIYKRNEQLKEMFQTQANEWLTMKQSLETKASTFGTWIIKENNTRNDDLYTHVAESRNSMRNTRDMKPKKKKNSWV